MKQESMLESTDAAGKVLHLSPTRPNEGRSVQHGCIRVGAASKLFFFFLGFALTWLDSRRFTLNRADSARIGSYQPYRVISADD